MSEKSISVDMVLEKYFVTKEELHRAAVEGRLKKITFDSKLDIYFDEKEIKKEFKPRFRLGSNTQLAIAATGTVAGSAVVSSAKNRNLIWSGLLWCGKVFMRFFFR